MAVALRVGVLLALAGAASPAAAQESSPDAAAPCPASCEATCDDECAARCPDRCAADPVGGAEVITGHDLLLAPRVSNRSSLRGAPSHRPDDREGAQTRDYLLYGGLSVFAAGWLATIVAAGATAEGSAGTAVGQGLIPGVGPLVLLAEGTTSDGFAPALPVLALVQGVGLLGALMGATTEYRTESATLTPNVGPGGASLRVTF